MNHHLKEQVQHMFKTTFKKEPLLVFSPGRINLIGEHTDYNNGFVFPAAINKGIYLAIAKTEALVSTVIALDENETFHYSLKTIKPETQNSWKNYVLGVVNETQKQHQLTSNVDIVFGGDVPIGSGMSSSAALENAVVYGINSVFELGLTKQEMIYISQQAEHNFVGVKCGIMDQFASMFGKEKKALLLDCKTLEHEEYSIQLDDIDIVLINSNVKHALAESEYNERRLVCEQVAAKLNLDTLREASFQMLEMIKEKLTKEIFEKANYVLQENQRTQLAGVALKNNNIFELGKLLYASHEGLSKKYKVSCKELDFLVEKAKISSAVIGARMMGGGFGGCTINLVRASEKEAFQKFIKEAYSNEFNNECSIYDVSIVNGTQII
ncbi:galactokinase [Tenacibaculum holothuriorum]|uniref:Galactokinase n=1 Tax=Tenacibaculum holothuriorum TaxID=1635173 RepID=A0A1Y2PAS1_9FLAO|nr:galactokinase [Tenacibaculum holothuriorum]OSY86828.1 galactokinase [Tenacibaculum holothuriorum]